jgi:hypothetical protein
VGRGVSADLQLRAERSPFVMVPRWLLYEAAVSEGALFLYCVLHDLVAGREGPTRPVTRAQLAETCGVSVDTVDRRLAELVRAEAVEKQAQVPAGGQQANVYQVWLTPPDARPVDNRSRNHAAPVEGCAKDLVNRSRDPAAPGQGCGTGSRTDAAPYEEPEEEDPPQPPKGGLDDQFLDRGVGRRVDGSNPRALRENPRAETAAAQATDHAAAIDAEVAARRREAEAAAAARALAESEAAALSAALDDELLAALLARAREGLPGPLAQTPVGLARAAIAYCRAAAARMPGDFGATLRSALAEPWAGPEPGTHPPALTLPPAPPGTAPLLDRVRSWLGALRPTGST